MIEFLKRFYSTTMYRMRMAQSIYVMLTCIIMIAMTSIDKVSIWFRQYGLNIHGLRLFILLFLTTGITFYLIGLGYDLYKLWRVEQRVVALRNPFIRDLLSPKEVIQLKNMWLPFFKAKNEEGNLDGVIEVIEHWAKEGKVTYGLKEGELEKIIKRMEKAEY